jgi:hypothetical protein
MSHRNDCGSEDAQHSELAITSVNADRTVTAHLIDQNAGNSYDSLMNKTRIFWAIECWQTDSNQALTERLRYLSDQKDDLNRKCPPIPKMGVQTS